MKNCARAFGARIQKIFLDWIIERECHFARASVVSDSGRACATVNFRLKCTPDTGDCPLEGAIVVVE